MKWSLCLSLCIIWWSALKRVPPRPSLGLKIVLQTEKNIVDGLKIPNQTFKNTCEVWIQQNLNSLLHLWFFVHHTQQWCPLCTSFRGSLASTYICASEHENNYHAKEKPKNVKLHGSTYLDRHNIPFEIRASCPFEPWNIGVVLGLTVSVSWKTGFFGKCPTLYPHWSAAPELRSGLSERHSGN